MSVRRHPSRHGNRPYGAQHVSYTLRPRPSRRSKEKRCGNAAKAVLGRARGNLSYESERGACPCPVQLVASALPHVGPQMVTRAGSRFQSAAARDGVTKRPRSSALGKQRPGTSVCSSAFRSGPLNAFQRPLQARSERDARAGRNIFGLIIQVPIFRALQIVMVQDEAASGLETHVHETRASPAPQPQRTRSQMLRSDAARLGIARLITPIESAPSNPTNRVPAAQLKFGNSTAAGYPRITEQSVVAHKLGQRPKKVARAHQRHGIDTPTLAATAA